MNNKPSANDLSLSVHETYKKYGMKDYYKAYCDLMIRYASSDVGEKLKEAFGDGNNVLSLHNSVVDFINTTSMSEEDTNVFLNEASQLQTKYPFDKYCKECSALRRKFLQDRLEYFYNKIQCIKIVRDSDVDEVSSHIYAFQDSLLAKWIDNSIKKIKPKGIQITYEDLTGKPHTIYAIHKEPSFDEEFAEAQLIDRYSGIGIFDSFLLHSFYDSITHKWVYVPITLIIDMKSEYISELLEEIEDNTEDEEGSDGEVL